MNMKELAEIEPKKTMSIIDIIGRRTKQIMKHNSSISAKFFITRLVTTLGTDWTDALRSVLR